MRAVESERFDLVADLDLTHIKYRPRASTRLTSLSHLIFHQKPLNAERTDRRGVKVSDCRLLGPEGPPADAIFADASQSSQWLARVIPQSSPNCFVTAPWSSGIRHGGNRGARASLTPPAPPAPCPTAPRRPAAPAEPRHDASEHRPICTPSRDLVQCGFQIVHWRRVSCGTFEQIARKRTFGVSAMGGKRTFRPRCNSPVHSLGLPR